jgi:hypothetical protein
MRSFTFSNVSELRIEFWARTNLGRAPIYVEDEVMAVKVDLQSIPTKKLDWEIIVKIAQKAVNAHTRPRTFSIKNNIFRVEFTRGSRAIYNTSTATYSLYPIISRVSVLVGLDSMDTARDLKKLSSRNEVSEVIFTNKNGKRSGKLLSTLNYQEKSKLQSTTAAIGTKEKGFLKKAGQSLWSKISPSLSSLSESLR